MNINYYTLLEVLSTSGMYDTFENILKETALEYVPTMLEANYGDWFGLWTEETDSAKVKAECINTASKWCAYLKLKSEYILKYMDIQSGISGKSTNLRHYINTPETESDYSGDTHISDVTKVTTESDNIYGLQYLKPCMEQLITQFRIQFLLPEESI